MILRGNLFKKNQKDHSHALSASLVLFVPPTLFFVRQGEYIYPETAWIFGGVLRRVVSSYYYRLLGGCGTSNSLIVVVVVVVVVPPEKKNGSAQEAIGAPPLVIGFLVSLHSARYTTNWRTTVNRIINCISSYGDMIGSTSAFAGGGGGVALLFFHFRCTSISSASFGGTFGTFSEFGMDGRRRLLLLLLPFIIGTPSSLALTLMDYSGSCCLPYTFTKTLGGVFMIHGLIPGD
jgi:hypothetical protein